MFLNVVLKMFFFLIIMRYFTINNKALRTVALQSFMQHTVEWRAAGCHIVRCRAMQKNFKVIL